MFVPVWLVVVMVLLASLGVWSLIFFMRVIAGLIEKAWAKSQTNGNDDGDQSV